MQVELTFTKSSQQRLDFRSVFPTPSLVEVIKEKLNDDKK